MALKIFYKASVHKDLKALDRPAAKRVLAKLEHALPANPNAGALLSGEFEGLFRYRIGDYRVIYAKIPEGLLILRIAHRKEAYR